MLNNFASLHSDMFKYHANDLCQPIKHENNDQDNSGETY